MCAGAFEGNVRYAAMQVRAHRGAAGDGRARASAAASRTYRVGSAYVREDEAPEGLLEREARLAQDLADGEDGGEGEGGNAAGGVQIEGLGGGSDGGSDDDD